MSKKYLKYLKISVLLAIIFAFVWFIMVYPTYKFEKYEAQMKKAAERYFELNQTKRPTGNRVATVSLQTLFKGAYLKEDFYIPYTKKACSPTNSWVKTTKKDGEYKYYIYLECGALKSNVDHKGPVVELNGKDKMTIEVGEEFKDPGVKKVYDKKDGNIDKETIVTRSTVNPNEIGDYNITYTAVDYLGNKTVVERQVTVVNTLKSQVKKLLNKETRFKGNPTNNNINISNMRFKIVGLDENNDVIVVSDYPVSYVNYNKIDKWLNEYYYELLSDEAKKIIVESEYCNGVKDASSTECTSKTETKKIYYPSVQDVNLAQKDNSNFMIPKQLSWINKETNKATSLGEVYRTINNELYIEMQQKEISTIRPMFKIKGNIKISSGNGTVDYPFVLTVDKKLTGDNATNDLKIGDIVKNKGIYYRVIEKNKDGTTKVITMNNITAYNQLIEVTNEKKTPVIYNPNQRGNIGYKINNDLAKYIDKSILTVHEVEVPIYENDIVYGTETNKKKYKVLFSAPNIFEIYSAINYEAVSSNDEEDDEERIEGSCWYINSSKKEDTGITTNNLGDIYTSVYQGDKNGVKVVAYLKKDLNISSGEGTYKKPYTLK